MKIRFDDEDDHDKEASVASSRGYAKEDSEEEDEEEDWFSDAEAYRDLYRNLEDDMDAVLEKELDEQMEAMWDEYSVDVHAQIQNELDRALQQQLDEQFEQYNYNYNREELVKLEEEWDIQEYEDEHNRQCQYEREELEPSPITRRFTQHFPVEHHSSVESINALIQQVVEKHRRKLEL